MALPSKEALASRPPSKPPPGGGAGVGAGAGAGSGAGAGAVLASASVAPSAKKYWPAAAPDWLTRRSRVPPAVRVVADTVMRRQLVPSPTGADTVSATAIPAWLHSRSLIWIVRPTEEALPALTHTPAL